MRREIVYTFRETEEVGERLICICEDIFYDRFFLLEFMGRGGRCGGRLVCGTKGVEFGV